MATYIFWITKFEQIPGTNNYRQLVLAANGDSLESAHEAVQPLVPAGTWVMAWTDNHTPYLALCANAKDIENES